MNDGLTKTLHDAPRKICGVGYVILSRAQDADSYIASCFRNNRISIITDEGEVIPGCIVAKNVWQYLEFPADNKSRGSELVWINVPYQNRVIILDIIHKRDELSYIQTANQFKFQREVGDNVVTVQGDGQTGTMILSAQGNDDGEGQVYIKVLNSNELAVLSMYVQGEITVDVEQDLNIRVGNQIQIIIRDENNPNTQASLSYVLGTGLAYVDEFNNKITAKDGGIYNEVKTGKVYARALGSTSEPGLLGNKTYQLLNEIQSLLSSMVTILNSASAGSFVLAPPVLAASSAQWQQSITSIIRELGQIKAQNFELS